MFASRPVAWCMRDGVFGAACAVLIALVPSLASAQSTLYWTGSSTWADAVAWSTSLDGSSAGSVPTSADVGFFSATTVTSGPTISLDADRSLAGLAFGGSAAGTTTLTGGGTNALLTLGASGISMSGGSVPAVTIGSVTANQGVGIALGASQTWTNNASPTLTVVGGVSRASGDTTSRTLTVGGGGPTTISGIIANGGGSGALGLVKTGTGTLTLSGANTYSGGTVVDAGVFVLTGGMSYSGTITINNGGIFRPGASDRWGDATTGASAPIVINAGGLLQSNNTYNTLINLALAGGTLQCTGGASAAFPSFGLKGTITVSGTSASRIDVGSPGNGNNGINIGETFSGGSNLAFNVADATSSAAADLVVAAVMRNANNSDRRPSGLIKNGLGTMQLTARNEYNGATTVNAGILELDFTNLATPTNVVGNNGWGGTGLVLGGGTLRMKGKASGASSQAFNTFNVQAGASRLLVDPNGGTGSTVSLAGINATTAGGSALIGRAADAGTGTVTITSTTARDATTGIYTPRIVFTDGTTHDWTTSTSAASPFTLSALASGSYVALATSGSDANNSVVSANSTLAGPVTTNTLKVSNPASGQTLTLSSGTSILSAGGLLATGSEAFTITGGALTSGNGGGAYEMLVHQYSSGTLTLGSALANNGANAVALTKAGPGTLTLTGTSTYTGATYVTSGSLVLGGAGQLNNGSYSGAIATSGAFVVATSASQTLGGVISGTGTLVKTGTGTLTLSGANSYSGGTVVDAGVLVLSGGLSYTGTITINDGGVFRPGASDRWGNAGTTASAPIVINAGGLLQSNNTFNTFINPTLAGGTLQCTGGFSTTWPSFGLKGTVTVTGTSASRIDVGGTGNANNGLNLGPNTAGGGSITFQVADVTSSAAADLVIAAVMRNADNNAAMPSSILKTGAGTMQLTAVNTFTGGLTISAGEIELAGAGQLGGGNYAGAIANSGTLRVATSANQSLTGTISGAGALVKSGAGTLTLTSTANSFAGGTTLDSGAIVFSHGALGSSGAITINAGTLRWAAGNAEDISSRLALPASGGVTFDTGTNAVSLATGMGVGSSAAVTKAGAGTLTLTGSNGYTGATTITTGTLALSGAGNIASSSGVAVGSGAVLDIATASGLVNVGALSGTGSVALGGNTLRVNQSSEGAFDGVIGGSGGFTKAGGGQLTITNAQSFTGAMAVAEGLLLLQGGNFLSQASRIIVASGAALESTTGLTIVDTQTLGGYGTVYGDVTFAAGSFLAPGGSVGALAGQYGSATLSGSMTYVFELNDAGGTPGGGESGLGWDLFSTGGAITLAATAENPILLDLVSLSGTSPGPAIFDETSNYAWKFLEAGSPISFDAQWFQLDTSGFDNLPANPERFSVVRGDALFGTGFDNQLYVVYAAVPEPATLTLAAAGVVGVLALRRKPRATRPKS